MHFNIKFNFNIERTADVVVVRKGEAGLEFNLLVLVSRAADVRHADQVELLLNANLADDVHLRITVTHVWQLHVCQLHKNFKLLVSADPADDVHLIYSSTFVSHICVGCANQIKLLLNASLADNATAVTVTHVWQVRNLSVTQKHHVPAVAKDALLVEVKWQVRRFFAAAGNSYTDMTNIYVHANVHKT
jgi:hypothetical protein